MIIQRRSHTANDFWSNDIWNIPLFYPN
jgi:hypothetical protein